MFLLGTVVNALAILFGTALGMVLPSIPDRMKSTILQGLGLAVILIGFSMALQDTNDILIIIFSLVAGGWLGEWMNIEGALHRLGQAVERRTRHLGSGRTAEAFVTTSLIFCVGSMAVVGAIQSGVSNNNSTLYAKSLLDGFTALVFSSALGIGVILSVLPVLVYEGGIAILSHLGGAALNSPPVIQCMTAAGGLLIAAIGFNLLGIRKILVGNLLPAMFLAAVLKWGQLQAAGIHLSAWLLT
ncbi:MAG: DUF554 domain-containing protein [Alicyclobacillus herbarius]|uniref:DUF554 domain-containing protein n=1 Tax=Alicyclobacillus herbarius TaxID=122960 RepID=UPI0023541FF6|nr:DUF554 domain-containing protein [Alicyclobacillus herbarius]MCL6631771.1 DUF554 domain-containing protein [Alicyclobacillus herbarius]